MKTRFKTLCVITACVSILATATAVNASATTKRLMADIDFDGRLSVNDVTLLQKHLAEMSDISVNSDFADANRDGRLSVDDVTEEYTCTDDDCGYGL